MQRFFKAFWYISILVFLFSLFYFYAGITEKIVFSGISGLLDQFSKDELFYIAIGMFILINVFCFILSRLITLNVKSMTHVFVGGVFGFAAAVNFFFSSTLMTLLFLEREVHELYYLSYLGPLILLLWLIIFTGSVVKEKFKIGEE